jgi:energy-coupling factor transporter ATP-binding protein EcfA2
MSEHVEHGSRDLHDIHPDHRNDDRRVTYFAATHTRGKRDMFGIRAVDRGKHVYVIGKTGMGKSTMLENMAIQDIQNGEGIAFIDPHGSTAEKLLDFVPQERVKDVVYFAPFDTEYPVGFNVMEDVGYDKRHLVVSGLMGAFRRIWEDAWSARMEYILQNTMLALLEYPGSTLLDVNRMLTNKTFREVVIQKITDPIVRAFWTEEFAGFTDRYTAEATPAIQNKIGQFTANPLIRHIVGQSTSSFDLRKIMDEKKIFIVNLSKGRMGETNASLLGSMLTVKIYLAAMSRADEPAARMAKLPRFYFYVDEFQSMMNQAFADILSESRKYKLALTLANQYIEQMEETVRDAVFGNIGTLICFRVGPFDAEVLKTVFEPTFLAEDLVGLGLGQIYLTLMIDGVGSPPFSAETIPPIEAPHISYRDDVVTSSRVSYGRQKSTVEEAINQKQADFVMPPKEKKPQRDAPRSVSGWNTQQQGGIAPRDRMAQQAREQGSYGNPRSELGARIQQIRDTPADNRTNPQPTFKNNPAIAQNRNDIPRVAPTQSPQRVAPSKVNPHAGNSEVRSYREETHARKAAEEQSHRQSLRDAIDTARKEIGSQPKDFTPTQSPLDRLREKNARKAPPPNRPHEHTKPHVTRDRTSSHINHDDRRSSTDHQYRNIPPPEQMSSKDQNQERPRVQNEARVPKHEHASGEVSHRELLRVLNGRDRDHDDL